MTFWLRYFPLFARPKWSRGFRAVGSTVDRWQGSSRITVKEHSWEGLASISIRVGRQSLTVYGSSISELQASLRQIPDRISKRDFLPASPLGVGGFSLSYNYAHSVTARGRVFDSEHPANRLYSNSLDAVVHSDGAVSAVAGSRRPWHLMQMAFAPGFFDGIERYLNESQSEQDVVGNRDNAASSLRSGRSSARLPTL